MQIWVCIVLVMLQEEINENEISIIIMAAGSTGNKTSQEVGKGSTGNRTRKYKKLGN